MSAATRAASATVDWKLAREQAYDAVVQLAAEPVPLIAATGRVTAHAIRAEQDIPHYASSAMDGWVVAGAHPWHLDAGHGPLRQRSARPVVTGGLLPDGTEAVLRSEHGQIVGGLLEPKGGHNAPTPGTDVRPPGEEALAGEVVIPRGTRLNPVHVALAAACAQDVVLVTGLPRVELLLSGDEVDDAGVPEAGRVRDSFGPTLPALVGQLGGLVVASRRLPDRRDATIAALEAGADVELVITTGGTGFSPTDHLRGALAELGADILVPGLATRPGGPALVARMRDGRLLVGLPGNPLAALIALIVLAAPALEGWSGSPLSPLSEVTLERRMPGHSRSTTLAPYRIRDGGVVPSPWVGSGMLRGLADSSGIVAIPPGGLEAGTRAAALRLPWRSA